MSPYVVFFPNVSLLEYERDGWTLPSLCISVIQYRLFAEVRYIYGVFLALIFSFWWMFSGPSAILNIRMCVLEFFVFLGWVDPTPVGFFE